MMTPLACRRFSAALVAIITVATTAHRVALAESKPLMASAVQVLRATASEPLTVRPDAETWNLSKYDSVYFDLRNTSAERVTVYARAENPEAKGVTDNVRTAVVLEPGESRTMRLRLMRRPENPGYETFRPFLMYFKDLNVRDNTVDPSAIAKLHVWLAGAKDGQAVEVKSIRADGEGVAGPVPFFPFIDKYGQYKHTDWPDKIYEDADFAKALAKDQAEMASYPGPSDWDQWGGWKSGPRQKATGFFYPAKVDGKWWLVTPDGTLFWSYGPTGVGGGGEGSPVTDKEKWFEELPAKDGPLGKYWGKGRGARFRYYQNGKEWESFSFSGANAERKYGPNWREATADALHARMRNWGLNTIANWSDPVVYLKRKTPYVVAIHTGGAMLDHIPDVFSPAWAQSLDHVMDAQQQTTANDPWNIGYFVDNEWTWGSAPRALTVVKNAFRYPKSATKCQFVDDLKAKYTDIAALNEAWGTDYASWEALLEGDKAPPDDVLTKNERYRADAGEFGIKFAEKYFAAVRAAVKRVAPNNLYLGCRFHGHIDRSLMEMAAKHVDVIGYNIYDMPTPRLRNYEGIDKPFIVGEFGATSALGQTPWRGAIYSQEEGERLKVIEDYLMDAYTHPKLVGAHFFQFRDQPLSGRPDGEATLRGFVNGADTPHFDLVQMNRRLAYDLYKTRQGSGRRVE